MLLLIYEIIKIKKLNNSIGENVRKQAFQYNVEMGIGRTLLSKLAIASFNAQTL